MPRTGYWVECIPLSKKTGGRDGLAIEEKNYSNSKNTAINDLSIEDQELETQELYSASIPSIPEASAFANSPDAAIDKLKDKLKRLRHHYDTLEKPMPRTHNPIRPPKKLRDVPGWLSIYIEIEQPDRH